MVGQGEFRGCGEFTDAGRKWVPKPPASNRPITINDQMSQPEKYRIALTALIAEMRKDGSGRRRIPVTNGEQMRLDGNENVYRFEFDGEQDLFEGATLIVDMDGERENGQIVSVAGKILIVSFTRSHGPSIPVATLLVDNTAMMESLVKRFTDIEQGRSPANVALASDAISNIAPARPVAPTESIAQEQADRAGLNGTQRMAIATVLVNDVTYIWGPPGTGKTKTLGSLIELLIENGKRVLICSNTNQAVDQVLLKLCRTMGTTHPAIDGGRIVRVGKIHNNELANDFSAYVSVDGNIERRSATLNLQMLELNRRDKELQVEGVGVRKSLELFRKFDEAEESMSRVQKMYQNARQAHNALQAEEQRFVARGHELRSELEARNSSGFLLKLLKRSEEAILAEARVAQTKAETARGKRQEASAVLDKLKADKDAREPILLAMVESLRGLDRQSIERRNAELEHKLSEIKGQMQALQKQLAELAQSIIANAIIVGATATKAYLSAQDFIGFDVVIIDEASMVMMPVIYHAASLAKEKVVISGDFMQLQPILPNADQTVLSVIGGDIFSVSGITRRFLDGGEMPRTVMLDTQFRMAPQICGLINNWIYKGRLLSAPNGPELKIDPSLPYSAPVTIIDTSKLAPFTSRDQYGSHYNLTHAMLVKNLCLQLVESGFATEDDRLGVCTPYAAQAKLIKRLMADSAPDSLINVGTVHRYQGDEKEMMILDIPDSLGEWNVGVFLQADSTEDDGAKLFNVAVSRARNHLVIVANLNYLDKHLPPKAFLRHIIAEGRKAGVTIDAHKTFPLWAPTSDTQEFEPVFAAENIAPSALFDDRTFYEALRLDVERATSEIVIFSAFYTARRVAFYEQLFARKISEGVRIRCVTRPPRNNGSMDASESDKILKSFEKMGIVVDTRDAIHEKVVIIDRSILWSGSLNALSNSGSTDEMMTRTISRATAIQVANFLAKGRNKPTDGDATQKENPPCGQCGHRAALLRGRYGHYWQCEEQCGWSESVKSAKGDANVFDGKQPPDCPLCKIPMKARFANGSGFWGCSNYPACKQTCTV